MIRIVVPLEIQQGRGVRPIKPLISWELQAGVELALPTELESILIREGFAEPVGPEANTQHEAK